MLKLMLQQQSIMIAIQIKRSQLKILYWMLKEMPRVVPSLMGS